MCSQGCNLKRVIMWTHRSLVFKDKIMPLRRVISSYGNTVRCRYNVVTFLTNIHKRHPIARPLGRGMGCLLWIQHVIDTLPQSPFSFM